MIAWFAWLFCMFAWFAGLFYMFLHVLATDFEKGQFRFLWTWTKCVSGITCMIFMICMICMICMILHDFAWFTWFCMIFCNLNYQNSISIQEKMLILFLCVVPYSGKPPTISKFCNRKYCLSFSSSRLHPSSCSFIESVEDRSFLMTIHDVYFSTVWYFEQLL